MVRVTIHPGWKYGTSKTLPPAPSPLPSQSRCVLQGEAKAKAKQHAAPFPFPAGLTPAPWVLILICAPSLGLSSKIWDCPEKNGMDGHPTFGSPGQLCQSQSYLGTYRNRDFMDFVEIEKSSTARESSQCSKKSMKIKKLTGNKMLVPATWPYSLPVGKRRKGAVSSKGNPRWLLPCPSPLIG